MKHETFPPAAVRRGGRLNNTLRPPPELASTFALEQLTGLTKFMSSRNFWSWVVVIFGSDITLEMTQKLWEELTAGSFPNPPIEIVKSSALRGHQAAYNSTRNKIRVASSLIHETLTDNDSSCKLMIALVEEFGHHVDYMLRNVYSSIAGDAPFDEGASFAHSIVLIEYDRTESRTYAHLRRGQHNIDLSFEYKELHQAVKKYLNEKEIREDDKSGDEEYFGAGEPKFKDGHCFTHLSIDRKALQRVPNATYTDDDIKRIYFGSYERDFSQIVDPKLVYHPVHNEYLFKRDTLVKVVAVLAEAEFGSHPDFRVTRDNLGLYIPIEHIDNPSGIKDASIIDPDFRGACNPVELQIDPKRWMKNYIATEGGNWKTSTGYIAQELQLAYDCGRNAEGFRHLGNALHTLEDFYAHSNFIELALRKVGFTKVDPWVPVTSQQNRLPVVTGSFGGLDTAAVIILEIGEILEKTDPFEIKRTKGQKILLILMRDKYPRLASYYDAFLTNMEDFKRNHPTFWKVLHYTIGKVKDAILFSLGMMLCAIGNQIDEVQSHSLPNSTDPTHTQISKDHHDHPFHDIASHLAIEATIATVTAMEEAWKKKTSSSIDAYDTRSLPVAKVANSYIVHPEKTSWMDKKVKDWGDKNPDKVRRGESRTWVKHYSKMLKEKSKKWTKNYPNIKKALDWLQHLGKTE
ncbi:HET-C-related protein [Acidobacteriota bacterium]